MKNKQLVWLIVISLLVIVVGSIFYFNQNSKNDNTLNTDTDRTIAKTEKIIPKAIVYKSSTCGCCRVYVSYLKKQGFDVEVQDMQDTQSVKNKYQISDDKLSCHTTVVDNYFFEGHIPIEAINKVLEEKPAIKGLALPGMPSGSPGMPGPKYEKFAIYQLANNLEWSNYINL